MDIPIKPTTSTLNRGYTIALAGVLFWSTTGIFIKYLVDNYPLAPLTLAFWRNVFTTSALAIGLLIFRRGALRVDRRNRRFLLFYGLALTFMNATWTYSVALNGAAVSTVLVYASPGVTAIVARFLFKERLTPIHIFAIAGSVIGCVLVAGAYDPAQWNVHTAGIVAGILSAFGFSFYSLMGKVASTRRINSWSATLYAFAIATLALAFTQNGDTVLSLGAHWDGWFILFILAVIPTLGGFGLYTASMGYLPAGTANLIATLEPVLTTILAMILLREALTAAQFWGGALIIGSVVSLRLEER